MFTLLLTSISLFALARASPSVQSQHYSSRQLPGTRVTTPLGDAQGSTPIIGVSRFAVKYASARRWETPVVADTWQLPNNSSDPTALPLACPQSNLDPSQYSEDCLSMLLYVPNVVTVSCELPVFVWIHGGSFVMGSATGPGLDGTKLASATNTIVAVIQYRLGGLAFNAPNGRTNFAVQDVVASLEFLQKVAPSFGGDSSKITIAGQSSGANMIRAILAAPSASSLFRSAILESDPMGYGFLSTSIQSKLQDYFNEQVNCSAKDTSCVESLSLSTVLSASDNLFANAVNIEAAATPDEPMRPVYDGDLITSTLTSTTPFPKVSKHIILSTVLQEAAPSIYIQLTSPVNKSFYEEIVLASLQEPEASNLLQAPYYQVSSNTTDARAQLVELGTDRIWRCPVSTFARSWTRNGGRAYVAQYTLGATYPDNQGVPFCTEPGHVCHEDDIEIVFGTVNQPTQAQSSLIREVQARYKAFLHTGDPNPFLTGFSQWSPATDGNFSAHPLGTQGAAPIGGCNTNFWGSAGVPYDYQIYGL